MLRAMCHISRVEMVAAAMTGPLNPGNFARPAGGRRVASTRPARHRKDGAATKRSLTKYLRPPLPGQARCILSQGFQIWQTHALRHGISLTRSRRVNSTGLRLYGILLSLIHISEPTRLGMISYA